MTDNLLRFLLPVYFLVYFLIVFVMASLRVARSTGKNPLVFPKDDSAYSLVGIYFKLILLAIFGYVAAFAVEPDITNYLAPFQELNLTGLKYIGLALLVFALCWSILAQYHMGNSWRIGIDEAKTDLVMNGLFKVSRNPIFFGMILSMLGLFALTPNLLSLVLMIIATMLMQIQVRLEEAHLASTHGAAYADYKKRVRRFI